MTQPGASAVDSNVLLDVLTRDESHAMESRARLNAALAIGSLVVTDVVLAEIAAAFTDHNELQRFLADSRLQRSLLSMSDVHAAGVAWREYAARRPRELQCAACGATNRARCESCGEALTSRQHIVADFLIGAHAMSHADRLLTRDRGFYAAYFPELALA